LFSMSYGQVIRKLKIRHQLNLIKLKRKTEAEN
jgi:hypothetical protein